MCLFQFEGILIDVMDVFGTDTIDATASCCMISWESGMDWAKQGNEIKQNTKQIGIIDRIMRQKG